MIALLRKTLAVGLLLLVITAQTYAQTPIPMPDYVLAAARALNARYGNLIDVNNVGWNYRNYSISGNDLNKLCPNIDAIRPTFPANSTMFYIVTFNTLTETWRYIVYTDQSYFGPCETHAPPTAIPVVPSFTPINWTPSPTWTPTLTLTPSLTWTPSPTPTITLTPSPTLTLTPSFTPTLIPTLTLTPTPSGCQGLASRLSIGQPGRVTDGGIPNNVRAIPNVQSVKLGEIPGGGVFMVLDGPRCSLDGTWWQVNYQGMVGWTLEGLKSAYYTEPATLDMLQATPTFSQVILPDTPAAVVLPAITPIPETASTSPVICNPALPSRLQLNQPARVTPGGSANNVRAQEGRSSQYVGEIPPGGVFSVLEGPRCTGDGAWWRVDYNGLQGWTIEGMEGSYWVEPALPDLQPITLNNLAQLRPLPNWTSIHGNIGQPRVSDQGEISAFVGGPTQWWTPQDMFAPAAALTWVSSPGTPTHFYRVENGQLNAYDYSQNVIASFPALPEVIALAATTNTMVFPIRSDNRLWSIDWTGGDIHILAANRNRPDFGQIRILPNIFTTDIKYLRFSEDESILVGISTTEIYIWDTTTWQPRHVHTFSASDVFATLSLAEYALSASGKNLLITIPENAPLKTHLFRIPLQENATGQWFALENVNGVSAAFVRDDLLLISGRDGTEHGLLLALPLDFSSVTPLLTDIPPTFGVAANPSGTLIAVVVDDAIRVLGVWQP
jgi:hypothetical protein